LVHDAEGRLSDDKMISDTDLEFILAKTSMEDGVLCIDHTSDRELLAVPIQFGMLSRNSVIPRDRPARRNTP
jgi:hypothetical protein